MTRPIRILLAKPGLDGHDRGAKVVAKALKEAGCEVIYTGLHQTIEMIAESALQEDVDAIGLSIHSGSHLALLKSLQTQMQARDLEKPIFVGGIIPDSDRDELMSLGVKAIFGPGSSLKDITSTVKTLTQNTDIHP